MKCYSQGYRRSKNLAELQWDASALRPKFEGYHTSYPKKKQKILSACVTYHNGVTKSISTPAQHQWAIKRFLLESNIMQERARVVSPIMVDSQETWNFRGLGTCNIIAIARVALLTSVFFQFGVHFSSSRFALKSDKIVCAHFLSICKLQICSRLISYFFHILSVL